MKKLFTILILLGVTYSQIFPSSGFWNEFRSYIGINIRGTIGNYTIWSTSVGNFNTANLGIIQASADVFKIDYWDAKTFENSGSSVSGVTIHYHIYKNGERTGVFLENAGALLEDMGGGNKKWGKATPNGPSFSTYLDPGATYKLEIFIKGTGSDGDFYDSNGGANYIATFTTDAGLPVELTSFGASLMNSIVNLKWETATEVNNYGFEVERKSTNADWSKIGFVEGHNSTNSPKYYNYSDKPVGTGKIAYRLKQIDNDGQFEYSPVVEVLVDNLPNGFVMEQNYPNPFNPETSIRFALKEDTKATLKVYNSLGAEIATLFDGTAEAGRYYDVKFGGSELASGFYIYKLVAGEYVSVKKMLLMK